MSKLEIKIKSFDSPLVENTAKKIIVAAGKAGTKYSGPIPLPVRREIFTILRSVHVNKKSREQFELRTHKRLIVIKNANTRFIDYINNLDLPSGVQIEVKQSQETK